MLLKSWIKGRLLGVKVIKSVFKRYSQCENGKVTIYWREIVVSGQYFDGQYFDGLIWSSTQ